MKKKNGGEAVVFDNPVITTGYQDFMQAVGNHQLPFLSLIFSWIGQL